MKDKTLMDPIYDWVPDYIDHHYIGEFLIKGKIKSMPFLNINSDKEEYLKYFNNCWLLTESLFASLKSKADFYQQPYHQLRHPLIFYYGHVAVLYINKSIVAGLITKEIDKNLEKILEVGVGEMTWDVDTKNNKIEWPELEAVIAYRKKAYQLIKEIILQNDELFNTKVNQNNPLWAILMSFEHERIHLETSSVIIRELDIKSVQYPKMFDRYSHINCTNKNPKIGVDYPKNELIKVKEIKVCIEKTDFSTYGWDNEYGLDKRVAESFDASKFLISNGEFFEFVKDSGYREDKFWCENGLKWRKFRNIFHPTFWVQDGPQGSNLYKLRTCFEIIDMQWSWPIIVNHFEAKAFCKYKSQKEDSYFRLPFEAEHKALGSYDKDFIKDNFDLTINFNLKNLSENSVDANYQNENGFFDVNGNVWQWLEDDFHPLNGFKIHNYYADFSTPCFDGEHKMIAGSSFFSTGNLASIYSRYHFKPHFFQHAGFRIVRSSIKNDPQLLIKFETKDPKTNVEYVVFEESGRLKIEEKITYEKRSN